MFHGTDGDRGQTGAGRRWEDGKVQFCPEPFRFYHWSLSWEIPQTRANQDGLPGSVEVLKLKFLIPGIPSVPGKSWG